MSCCSGGNTPKNNTIVPVVQSTTDNKKSFGIKIGGTQIKPKLKMSFVIK